MDDNEPKATSMHIPRPWMVAGVLVLTGGGAAGGWSVKSDIAVHEARQDDQIARNSQASVRNGKTIRNIAVLLVQQGRHVDRMMIAVAKGQEVPPRPDDLNAIESRILSEPDD